MEIRTAEVKLKLKKPTINSENLNSETLLEGDNSAARRISAEVNVGTQNSKYSRIINFE